MIIIIVSIDHIEVRERLDIHKVVGQTLRP